VAGGGRACDFATRWPQVPLDDLTGEGELAAAVRGAPAPTKVAQLTFTHPAVCSPPRFPPIRCLRPNQGQGMKAMVASLRGEEPTAETGRLCMGWQVDALAWKRAAANIRKAAREHAARFN
jgi:hypothetical protein